MLDYYGEIAIFYNITFNYGKKDHALKSGRPCIVLNNDFDLPIILPLTTVYHGGRLKSYYYEVKKTDMKILNKNFPYKDVCYANINGITRANQYYYDVMAYLNYDTYYRLLKYIGSNYMFLSDKAKELYLLILDDLKEHEKTLNRVVNNKVKRLNRQILE